MAKILVVDDEDGIRQMIGDILTDAGHKATGCPDAQSAREAVAAEAPDLILLDIWMPDTDGVSLLKEWNARRMISCPVIMMSGHATIDTAIEATKYGAFDFIEKPMSMGRLMEAVRRGLDRSQSLIPPASPRTAPAARQPADAARAPAARSPVQGIDFDAPLREARDQFERLYFTRLLEAEHYSMTRVSERSGLERTHLYRKLKALNVSAKKGDAKPAKDGAD